MGGRDGRGAERKVEIEADLGYNEKWREEEEETDKTDINTQTHTEIERHTNPIDRHSERSRPDVELFD